MKWAFSTAGLVVMGLVGIVIIILFQSITVNNEHDYYLLKETAEAAMFDAIDIPYYRDTGEVKIVQEKFVENFIRRLAEAANKINISDYSVEFYDIMEKPPKASILIKTGLGQYKVYGSVNDYNISNQLDAILEADDTKLDNNYYNNCKTKITRYYYFDGATGKGSKNGQVILTNLKPGDGYKIVNVKYIRQLMTYGDIDALHKQVRSSGIIDKVSHVADIVAPQLRIVGNEAIGFADSKYSCSSSPCFYGFVADITWKHKACDEKKGGN